MNENVTVMVRILFMDSKKNYYQNFQFGLWLFQPISLRGKVLNIEAKRVSEEVSPTNITGDVGASGFPSTTGIFFNNH